MDNLQPISTTPKAPLTLAVERIMDLHKEIAGLRATLMGIGFRARRPDRTFDEAIADLGWIVDETRAALSAPTPKEPG